MSTIPASQIVAINPAIINAGGSPLAFNALLVSDSSRTPIGQVLSFPTSLAVATYYGATSDEAIVASTYFLGFDNSNIKPGALLITQYPVAAVPAWLRGGNVSTLPITTLDALTGKLMIAVNGTLYTSSALTFTALGSFSAAAAYIQTNFSTFAGTVTYDSLSGGFLFTTTATGATETISYITSNGATASACTSTSTVLTIGGTVVGTFHVGDYVTGTDSTNSLPAGTVIVNQLTGATPGGAGTYTISQAAAPGNLSSCAVTAFSQYGTLATTLGLTQQTGAILSQGADAATPTPFMNSIVNQTQNWVSFFTDFNPDATGNANKLLFAAWANAQNLRYLYACWDSDVTPTTSSAATSSLGNILTANGSNGTVPIHGSDYTFAAFFCGMVASVDYTETNGAVDYTYKAQGGLTPNVTDPTTATNLIANGYNFYGAWATANQSFIGWAPGSITGEFKWADAYTDQVWLNNAFQLALMELLFSVKSLPYDSLGYGLQRAALSDPINAGLNFGAFAPGIPLSALQAAEVNAAAGLNISGTLSAQGWYLQILPAAPLARGQRKTNPINFWYSAPGSIQQISMSLGRNSVTHHKEKYHGRKLDHLGQ